MASGVGQMCRPGRRLEELFDPAGLVSAWGENVAGVGDGDGVPGGRVGVGDVADVPDDGDGGDVVAVAFEDRDDHGGGFLVLDCGWGVDGAGIASEVVPGAVDELVCA